MPLLDCYLHIFSNPTVRFEIFPETTMPTLLVFDKYKYLFLMSKFDNIEKVLRDLKLPTTIHNKYRFIDFPFTIIEKNNKL